MDAAAPSAPPRPPAVPFSSLFRFADAYDGFLFALILTGSRTKTLPVAIAEYGGEDIHYWSLSAAGVTVAFVWANYAVAVIGITVMVVVIFSIDGDAVSVEVQIFNLSPIVDAFRVTAPEAPTWLTTSSSEVLVSC